MKKDGILWSATHNIWMHDIRLSGYYWKVMKVSLFHIVGIRRHAKGKNNFINAPKCISQTDNIRTILMNQYK